MVWQARMDELESFQSDDGIDAKEKLALQAFNESAQLLTKARKAAAETLSQISLKRCKNYLLVMDDLK